MGEKKNDIQYYEICNWSVGSDPLDSRIELTDIFTDEVYNLAMLVNTAIDLVKNAAFDEPVSFRCPLCSGNAIAFKTSPDDQIHVKCTACSRKFSWPQ